jgi:hypothetical protein
MEEETHQNRGTKEMKTKNFNLKWLKASTLMLVLLISALQLFATEGLQELMPYKVWLENLEIHRSTLSPESQGLGWVIKENGLEELGRNALNEITYTYYRNRAGIDFVVYLDSWKIDRYYPISNTIGYRVGVVYNGPIISSEVAEVAVVNKAYEYQITTTGSPTKLHAENLPAGLTIDCNGRITGIPEQEGQYLITLYAENNRDWTTATLRLDVVSGNNGGGLLNYHTIVLDENLVVTRTHGDGPYSNQLVWIIKKDGTQVLGRNALSETRYQYYLNSYGHVYNIYLESLGQRVSNIVTYKPGYPIYSLNITSPSSHTGIIAQEIAPYIITTDKLCNQFSASGLPSGLNVTAAGIIVGAPTESGSFPVTISASGTSGVATKVVTFNIQQGDDNFATKYQLSINDDNVVTRTPGEHPGLVWVVRINGNHEVVRRSAVGEYSFSYYSDNASDHIHIRLEAWIKGKYRPVSNTISYRSNEDTLQQQPIFSMAESYSGYLNSAIDPILVQVSGDPHLIEVNALPPGLTYDSETHLIQGTPTNSGVFTPVITAVNSYGTTECNLKIEIIPDTRISNEDRFQLTVLPEYNIMRTFGTDESLRWTVYRNGQRIYEYTDTGNTMFNYKRHSKSGEFTVFLEAFVDGEFTRVSNIVGYRTLSDQQGPILINDRKYVLQSGTSVDIQLQATSNPIYFEADQLPVGLILNGTNGRITGTPMTVRVTESIISITEEDAVSQTPVTFEVRTPESSETYSKLYLLALDELNRITRSPGYHESLTWIISKDDEPMLERSAKNELTYTYYMNYQPGVYTCYLQAYLDGAYRQVSNSIEYTVENNSDFSENGFPNLVEHAMGTRAGTEPHHTTPTLINVRTEGDSSYLTYRYSVNTDATDVRLFVDSAKSIGNWSRATPISVTVISADEYHEVRDVIFCIDGNHGFLRLGAELVD